MWASNARRFFWYHLRRANIIRQLSQGSTPTKSTMSGGMAAAALYAYSLSTPARLGAAPEDVDEKTHHLKNKKGFTNPWDSWKMMSTGQIMWAMLTYAGGSSLV